MHGRVRDGLLPFDQRRELERDRRLARAQARGAVRKPLLHRFTHLHSVSGDHQASSVVGKPRNDGPCGAEKKGGHATPPDPDSEADRATTSSAVSSFGNLLRATSRQGGKQQSDEATASVSPVVGGSGFRRHRSARRRSSKRVTANVEMYERITAEDTIGDEAHLPRHPYTMGGLWVDTYREHHTGMLDGRANSPNTAQPPRRPPSCRVWPMYFIATYT